MKGDCANFEGNFIFKGFKIQTKCNVILDKYLKFVEPCNMYPRKFESKKNRLVGTLFAKNLSAFAQSYVFQVHCNTLPQQTRSKFTKSHQLCQNYASFVLTIAVSGCAV